ncbi:hypothetical protein AB6I73_002789 [Citrobacter amalonaticus]|uniref:hypothetical protein n=1 Tax=Citrobacter amalonaticus TaxID=35703 RepID=UPI001902F174|nr:hypothetical protein [Citrobacter amalonaticus]MBJ9078344.1 hypothetical protein [Citrobacter amalonaticus]MBW0869291.1 hypothetical protein [Citrobacter amalonaticus]
MRTLTTEEGLQILNDWLWDNIDCDSGIIFDNDEDHTDSAMLFPHVEQALNDVRDLHHLQRLYRAKSG